MSTTYRVQATRSSQERPVLFHVDNQEHLVVDGRQKPSAWVNMPTATHLDVVEEVDEGPTSRENRWHSLCRRLPCISDGFFALGIARDSCSGVHVRLLIWQYIVLEGLFYSFSV